MRIEPYAAAHREAVLELSIRAWEPVFPRMRLAVPHFVYDSFYPDGWQTRQITDLSAILDGEPASVDIAAEDATALGWVCTRIHPKDRMGEIYVLAVDPAHQGRGVGTALMDHALARIRQAGMVMAMVETGDDPGHASARAAYESSGFVRWPVARYFKELD
ncbi:GNAT family N-acetyltransferase [Brevibacterium daeguense]|uniref:GNAT family N-acetyltransferase n=1 Tax=Brevibacterium daeguense TaxID=909936 RepID=A0ABP8EIK9_9MICO|nr:GNAT family N-acetyltransferase [Brevibacterium daeguense]